METCFTWSCGRSPVELSYSLHSGNQLIINSSLSYITYLLLTFICQINYFYPCPCPRISYWGIQAKAMPRSPYHKRVLQFFEETEKNNNIPGVSIFKALIFFTPFNGVFRSLSKLLLSTNHNVPIDVSHSALEAQDQTEYFTGKNWELHRCKQGVLEVRL